MPAGLRAKITMTKSLASVLAGLLPPGSPSSRPPSCHSPTNPSPPPVAQLLHGALELNLGGNLSSRTDDPSTSISIMQYDQYYAICGLDRPIDCLHAISYALTRPFSSSPSNTLPLPMACRVALASPTLKQTRPARLPRGMTDVGQRSSP